tara:strand:- start:606 stop:1163 length:558 start_codon:yes stop_codon:yes gene_type:complete
MIIVAIDPGTRNLGWSVYDTDKCHFLSFGRYNLQKDHPKNKQTKYAWLVKQFIESSRKVFDMADAVCVEIQMQAKMKVIATAFQCFFWDKAHEVSPRSVRTHFDISMKNYSKNKKASVDLIPTLPTTLISQQNKNWFARFDKKKRDDVADAMLIALYWNAKKAPQTQVRPKKKRRRVYKKADASS